MSPSSEVERYYEFVCKIYINMYNIIIKIKRNMIRKIVIVLFASIATIACICMLLEIITGKLPIPNNGVDMNYVQKALIVCLSSTIIAGVVLSDHMTATTKM